jgi:hypothetical protein
MAGKDSVPRDLVAETVWMARAEMAERHQAYLVTVMREALAVIKALKPPQNGNGTIVRLEAAIASATGQEIEA